MPKQVNLEDIQAIYNEAIKYMWVDILKQVVLAINSDWQYRQMRSVILRAGNDCIRNAERQTDELLGKKSS